MNKFVNYVSLNMEPLKFDIRKMTGEKYTHRLLDHSDINPEIENLLDSLGITVGLAEVFFSRPYSEKEIHTDTTKSGDYAKLNWIYSAGDSYMNWYVPTEPGGAEVKQTISSTNYIGYTSDQVVLVHSEKINTASVIVQVGIPHNIKNLTHPRWAVCFVLRNKLDQSRLSVAEAHYLLRDYII